MHDANSMKIEKLNLDGVTFGSNICQCPTCKRVFSTVRNFDMHRTGPWENRKCEYPPDVGLVLSGGGIYKGAPPSKPIKFG